MNDDRPILATIVLALLWAMLAAIVVAMAGCEREEPEVPADQVLAELDAITEQLRQIRRELELVEAGCVAPLVTEQPMEGR